MVWTEHIYTLIHATSVHTARIPFVHYICMFSLFRWIMRKICSFKSFWRKNKWYTTSMFQIYKKNNKKCVVLKCFLGIFPSCWLFSVLRLSNLLMVLHCSACIVRECSNSKQHLYILLICIWMYARDWRGKMYFYKIIVHIYNFNAYFLYFINFNVSLFRFIQFSDNLKCIFLMSGK